jgi:two-component system, NtrC family, response regulator AtoC
MRTPMKDGPTEETDDVASTRLDVRDAWLVISGASGLSTMPLPRKPRIRIGRSRSCDIVIEDKSVSREHAAIFDPGGELRVEDLGSRNKTKVMGRALAPGASETVTIGCVIEIGHATILLQRGQPSGPREGKPAAQRAAEAVPGAVVTDPTMEGLYGLLEVIAPSALNVLLLGETGTGKEIFAAAIQKGSTRARLPFLRINCAGLAGSLLESELFGHEKGAFTGAVSAKKGLFEAADGGTLFLDEIGEMPIETQAKVLRVIESGEVTRLGGTAAKKIDVRYISATNRDLAAQIRDARFRSDLFFRLNGFTLVLPPLRERKGEIVPMAERFLGGSRLGPEVVRILEDYRWPGNVRELKSVIERAKVLSAGRPIEPAHLQLSEAPTTPDRDDRGRPADAPLPGRSKLRAERASWEQQQLRQALERTNGDRRAAAELLGVPYRTFLSKLLQHGVTPPRKR